MDVRDGRFLITGGLSLIGSHVAEKLVEAGAREVVLLDNQSLGSPATVEHLMSSGRVRFVRADVLKLPEVLEALAGVDGVFAMAAYLTISLSRDPWTGLDVNIRGLQNVLEACRWQRVKRVVFSSSIAVYGNALDGLVTEETPFLVAGMQAASAFYPLTKLVGEQLCALYQERYGVDYVALRYSTVYGERQHYRGVNALYIVETYDRIRKGERPVIAGDPREMHDYIYAGDVARANVLAMASAVRGEAITVATGRGTSIDELVRIILHTAGSTLTPEYRADTGRVRSASATKLQFSREKASRLLGWAPEVSLEEGIGRLIAWRQRTADAV